MRLLLRGAVNTTAACCDTVDIQLNNFTLSKQLLQNSAGIAVGSFITKLWRNNGAIADVKIDIAGGKVVVCIGLADCGGAFQRYDVQATSFGVRRGT